MSSSLIRLWSHAINALSRLRATILPLATLLNKERRTLRANLSALEAFCRRLVLTQAILDHASNARAKLKLSFGGAWSDAHSSMVHQRASLTTPGPKKPTLRFWPRARRGRARVRLLGPPTSLKEIWRAQHRDALIARLKRARLNAKPAHLRLADRIDALQRLLDAPRAALRRLARKLRLAPKLAHIIAARRAPLSPFLPPDAVRECESLCWSVVLNSS